MKKFFIEIGLFLLSIIKWFIFGNVAIYVATRIINFMNDPYMEDMSSTGFYREKLFPMFLQVISFMIVFGLVVSMFKILFKKDYKWQTIMIFIWTLSVILIAVF